MALYATKVAGTLSTSSGLYYDYTTPQPFDVQASDSSDYMDLTGLDLGPNYYFRIHAGKGHDTIIGTNSRDELWGDEGNDRLDGAGGNDMIYGGVGNDIINGGLGRDTVYAGLDNDIVDGGAESDWLFGGAGDDIVYGGDGNDYLHGDPGDDQIDGGTGNDRIMGNDGRDTLTGGIGADTFAFTNIEAWISHSWWGGREVTMYPDRITDFSSAAGDKLDLSALAENSAYSQIFSADDAVIRGFVYFKQSGTPGSEDFGTWLMFDQNGNQGGHDVGGDSWQIAFLEDVAINQIQISSIII
jgi:Ca2+-binding RTX toxin-like protein